MYDNCGSHCPPQLHTVAWQDSAQGTAQAFCFASVFMCNPKAVMYSGCKGFLLDILFIIFSIYLFIHVISKEHFT